MGSKPNEVTLPREGADQSDDAAKKEAALKGEIRETRSNMSQTVGEIEQKLKPERLKEEAAEKFEELKAKIKNEIMEEFEQAKEKLRSEFQEAKGAVREATIGRVEHMVHDAQDTVSEAGSTFVRTIRANPVPAVMIGVGLGWLVWSMRSSGSPRNRSYAASYRYGRAGYGYGDAGLDEEEYARSGSGGGRVGSVLHDAQERAGRFARDAQSRVGETAHHLQENVGQFARDAQQRVGETAHRLQDNAGQLVHQTQERLGQLSDEAAREARQAEAYLQRTLQANPLALGAVAFALGTAAGLALPHTQREDELLGRARDRLIEKAEDAAHLAVDKAQDAAKQAASQLGNA